MEPDVRAAYDAILHHMRTGGFADTMEDYQALAVRVCQAVRPRMWLKAQQRIDELEGGCRAGGVCPHCGQLL